jgi:two-component system, OmpR family, copper resistance phosphate regulon response regulator CusR
VRILLIEDSKKAAEAIAKGLRSEGYAVDIAFDGVDGEKLARINDNDIIILDLMLPRQDGWTTCANLRKQNILTPILMLTALSDVKDKIKGLDSGADDYLPKPFHFGELLARIRSLTRRKTEIRASVIEKFGLVLDLGTHKALREGKEITLTSKEFSLLELFMLNAGRIISRETISEHVWDMNFEPQSNVIESFVKFLRQKIDKGFSKPLLHTIRGSGYMFSDKEP